MPPMTDNQRESAIRERTRRLKLAYPNMDHKKARAMAEGFIERRAHLRGRYR